MKPLSDEPKHRRGFFLCYHGNDSFSHARAVDLAYSGAIEDQRGDVNGDDKLRIAGVAIYDRNFANLYE